MSRFSVIKESIFSKKERLVFASLLILFLFVLIRYTFWWFEPKHIPGNFSSSSLHILDIGIFGLLSFVVFISTILNIGSWFALWHGAKPKYVKPDTGLKVAFLTCFVPGSEPVEMLVLTLKAMKNVRYPHDTWVLDEGGSDEVKKICKGLGVKYFTRNGIAKYNQDSGKFRAKTKAGNHNAWGDCHAYNYDIVAQIDMDHVPQPDFFEKTLGYFRDPKVALVGIPQFYKNTKNWVARGAAEQSFFFQGPMQQGFYGCDMPFLIGTSHIYRTSAMEKIGGYAPTIVEDHLTGMNLYAKGFKGVFVPEILARGEGPLNWVDYFNQQMRWSYGLFEIFFKHSPKVLPKLKWRQAINYFISQLYYFTGVAVVIGFFLTFAYLVFGIRAASMDFFEWIRFSIPPFLVSLALQIYIHRFNVDPENEPVFGVLGMFLNFGANIIYVLAFIKFICGQKLTYMVTQKGVTGAKQNVPLGTFKIHLVFIILMFSSLLESFVANHSAIQLRFWAVFNVLTLGAVILSSNWGNILVKQRNLRFDIRTIRYGLNLTVGFIILASIAFTYTQFDGTAEANFDKQITQIVEAPISAKVMVPETGAYLGVSLYQHNDTNYLDWLQGQVSKKFAIVGYYQSWGVAENKFNKEWAGNISNNGSIPMVTWEPWVPVSGFDRSESKVHQESYKLQNIISGKFDGYIREYASDVKLYRKPVMIRFAQEMNGNWYPWGSTFNKPEEYVLAWRHVHEIFDSVGTTNVTWVWSPNEAYVDGAVPNADKIDLFYPGDDYVDWVGFSAFNWAGNYKNNMWRSPKNLFSYTLGKIKKFNKPVMIAETASAEVKSNASLKAKWISQLSEYVQSNPEIKGVIWFNTQDNGVDWTVGSSENSVKAFKESFGEGFLGGQILHFKCDFVYN